MWTSNAEWPDEVRLGITPNVSTDTHSSPEEARHACAELMEKGLGGVGLIFPVRVWTEDIKD